MGLQKMSILAVNPPRHNTKSVLHSQLPQTLNAYSSRIITTNTIIAKSNGVLIIQHTKALSQHKFGKYLLVAGINRTKLLYHRR